MSWFATSVAYRSWSMTREPLQMYPSKMMKKGSWNDYQPTTGKNNSVMSIIAVVSEVKPDDVKEKDPLDQALHFDPCCVVKNGPVYENRL